MRATEFLPESITPADQISRVREILQRDCAPALSAFPKPLWRGMPDKFSDPIMKTATWTGRAPKDSTTAKHNIFDYWFLKNCGHRFRSDRVMFASSHISTAGSYGSARMVFPIGEFKCCASPFIQDLTDTMIGSNTPDVITNILDSADYETGQAALNIAFKTGNEIMIACDEYYVINPVHYTFGLSHLIPQRAGRHLHTEFLRNV